MMQELLLALLGYDGPIFQFNKEQETFQTPEGVLSEQERTVVLRVLDVAVYYKQLQTFCRNNRHGKGRYRAALANAVTDATKVYCDCIVELEENVLQQPAMSLTHIHTTLHQHTPLLQALTLLLAQVGGVHGCRVLGVIHQHTNNAVMMTRIVMQQIEQKVSSILYYQLSQWFLYGEVMDPHREFFLQQKAEPEQGIEFVPELLPSHLPVTLAHKAMFVGEAIRDFEGKQRDERSSTPAAPTGLLQQHETHFTEQFTRLSRNNSFSLLDLTEAVEGIRATVSKHLSSVVLEAGLIDALHDLKGVLLLGRGELYHTLLDQAASLLDGPFNIAIGIQAVLSQCGQMVQLEDDLLDRFTICCSKTALDQLPQVVRLTQGHANTGWSSLLITYSGGASELQQLLQTPSVQQSYNSLFSFLLCVRRAQHRLNDCWITHLKDTRRMSQERCLWTLRHRLTLLVNGLQYYLQVDVLESHHYRLVSQLSECSDYQRVQSLIASYLSSLTVHCFLHHTLVSHCLAALLSLCHKLCDALQSHGSTLDVTPLSDELCSITRQLFLVLCSGQHLPTQQHTASLLARLDYNMHYRDLHKQRGLLGHEEESTNTSLAA